MCGKGGKRVYERREVDGEYANERIPRAEMQSFFLWKGRRKRLCGPTVWLLWNGHQEKEYEAWRVYEDLISKFAVYGFRLLPHFISCCHGLRKHVLNS